MTEESDHFISDWPSVQLPKSRSLEYWQSSLGGFVFRVLLRPPEKCKFEFTLNQDPPPPSLTPEQENIYPDESPLPVEIFSGSAHEPTNCFIIDRISSKTSYMYPEPWSCTWNAQLCYDVTFLLCDVLLSLCDVLLLLCDIPHRKTFCTALFRLIRKHNSG